MRRSATAAALMALAGACSPAAEPNGRSGEAANALTGTAPSRAAPLPRQAAPAPKGAAPAPDPRSAEAALEVARTYFTLVGAGRPREARRLFTGGGDGSGKSEEAFAADFRDYRTYRGKLGKPGPVEGAAGSSYVEIPVAVSGERRDGTPFRIDGRVTLRRVNDVPGATAEQRRWHISDIALGEPPHG